MEKKRRTPKKDVTAALSKEELELLNVYKHAYKRCSEDDRLAEKVRASYVGKATDLDIL